MPLPHSPARRPDWPVFLAFASVLGAPALAQVTAPTGGPPSPIVAPPPPPKPEPLPVPDLPVVQTTTLSNGVVVEDMKVGDGNEVRSGCVMRLHYLGKLKADGKVFDSTFERAQPIVLPISGVIPGFASGMMGMRQGGIRRIIIPSAAGYGPQGWHTFVPPNADLVFVVELLDVNQVEEVKGPNPNARRTLPDDIATTAHVIKDADGKILSQATEDNAMIWYPREFEVFSSLLVGMQPGDVRRTRVPAAVNVARRPTAHPTGRDLEIEVKLLASRPLPE